MIRDDLEEFLGVGSCRSYELECLVDRFVNLSL